MQVCEKRFKMFKISAEGGKSSVTFYCDKDEFSGVKRIAGKVCSDVKKVVDIQPEIKNLDSELPDFSVFFGTIGQSKAVETVAPQHNIDLNKLSGKREVYLFKTAGTTLIIIGSEKRGTIYGLFHLSELMGVSPLVDWCDIMPAKKESFELEDFGYISHQPAVRFRGFFINDEWPAFGNWAKHNFGGFNADMYSYVFELLLRMKGNYLWPAMWSARFSDDGPGLANAELADELGVVMGTSHHEPCCRAGEEYKYLRGPDSIYGDAWNFRSNPHGITKFWEDGLKRSGKFENVITVGMRGEADTAIMKDATLADNIELLRDVLKTQNNLIKKYVNPDISKVPRMLALYKEVEPYFYGDKHTKGLMGEPELDGVTLMLCDDNHGNLRTVPTEKMKNHVGGYGMYYHVDYHGWPYSFEWANTTQLPKIKEQMCAAYEFGIRDLWIVNVGDIMTDELPLNYFLDLAYNYDVLSSDESPVSEYILNWVCRQFSTLSDNRKNDVNTILNEYTKLAHMRRTECIHPDTFHPVNFCESDKILARAEKVCELAENLKNQIEKDNKIEFPGFYSQVYFPAVGTMNILRMQLYSGKNNWFASKGAVAANWYAKKEKECYEIDKKLVDEFDIVDDGKFYGMGWSEHFGFQNWSEAENRYPVYSYVEPTRKKRIVVWVDGHDFTTSGQDWTVRDIYLDDFKNPACKTAKINIANCGSENAELTYTFKDISGDWLKIDIEKDDEKQMEFAVLSINRQALSKVDVKKACLAIKGDDGHGGGIIVNVHIDAETPSENYPEGTFVQTTSYISIEAEHFVADGSINFAKSFHILPDYGKTLSAIKAYPVTASYPNGKNAPYAEYRFALEDDGIKAFDFFLNPSNPAYKDNKLQFIAEVNGVKILKDVVDKNFKIGDDSFPWGEDIPNNIRISSVYADCKKGLNILRIYPVTPNIVLEKIVIHDANTKMPKSYLGAPETYRIKRK